MLPDALTRTLLLLLPAAALTWLFVHREYPLSRWAGAVLAYLWLLQIHMLGFALGAQLGYWTFAASAPALYGVPVDVVLGMSLCCGPLPAILRPRAALVPLVLADFALTLLVLPLHPLEPLATPWLLAVSHSAVLPGLLLARWTADDTHLYQRAVLQALAWATLMFWLFPASVFHNTADSWAPLLDRPWQENAGYGALLLIPTAILGNALYVFARYGRGTAFPYDPPRHLVIQGIYRYVSNPMQVGIVLLMTGWGLLLQSPWITASAAVAVALFVVFRNVCNGSCQIGAVDPDWQRYQQSVRKWLPRLTPLDIRQFKEPPHAQNRQM